MVSRLPSTPLSSDYLTLDRSRILLGVATTFIVLELVAFSLRAVAERLKGKRLGWNDVLVVLALTFNLGICAVCLVNLRYVVGRMIAPLPKPGGTNYRAMIGHILVPILYLLALTCSKLMILRLFLRIFKIGPLRYLTYVIAAIAILHCIATTIVIFMQCIPLSLLWAFQYGGNCIDIPLFFRLSSIPNVTTDFMMLVVPLPTVWRLHASLRVKLSLMVTFLLASIGIVSAVLRLVAFVKVDHMPDLLKYEVDLQAYSIAEPGTMFLAACLVSCRSLYFSLSERASKVWSKHRQTSNGAENTSKIQGKVMPIENSRHVKGFNTLLLSALLREVRTGTESTENITLAEIGENGPASADSIV